MIDLNLIIVLHVNVRWIRQRVIIAMARHIVMLNRAHWFIAKGNFRFVFVDLDIKNIISSLAFSSKFYHGYNKQFTHVEWRCTLLSF